MKRKDPTTPLKEVDRTTRDQDLDPNLDPDPDPNLDQDPDPTTLRRDRRRSTNRIKVPIDLTIPETWLNAISSLPKICSPFLNLIKEKQS